MRRRRRDREPDTRLDWRDPDMPVLRLWESNWGGVSLKAFSPEEEQMFAQECMSKPKGEHWSRDPTYSMKRKR